MPARTEPVIETSLRGRVLDRARPVSRSPVTTFMTPGGKISLHDLAEQHRRGGRRVGRLDHEAVAGGEGRRDLPDRHHQRVVPGRHLGDDADRLAADVRRVAGQVLTGGLAFEHSGGTGEEADLVDRRRQLLGVGEPERLAGVLALDLDELVGALLHRVGELEQHLWRSAGVESRQVSNAVEAAFIARSTSSGRTTRAACANSSSVDGIDRRRTCARRRCRPALR